MHYLELIADETQPNYEDCNRIAFNNGIFNIKDDSLGNIPRNLLLPIKSPGTTTQQLIGN